MKVLKLPTRHFVTFTINFPPLLMSRFWNYTCVSLSPFVPIADPVFTWGEHEASHFLELLNSAYSEAIATLEN